MSGIETKYRILRIADIPNVRSGGMARYIHQVSDRLLEAGHEVEHVFADQLRSDQPLGSRWGRFVGPLRALRIVRRRLREGRRDDVVEIHEPLAAPYAAWRAWVGQAVPPLLVTVYALEARSLESRLRYARARGERVTLRDRLPPLSVVWQANYALRRADHISVETQEDLEYLGERLGVTKDRITLHPAGVTPLFLEEGPGERDGLLFVGTWLRRKGVLDLVPAMVRVLHAVPGVRLTVAGAGVPADRVLSDFPFSMRDRVVVVPGMDDEQALAALFRRHLIFVFPSVFEGMPLVLLEAAAAGLAIVTTPVCGMRDFIRDGVNGLLVPVGAVQELGDAVLRLLESPREAARLGCAAREDARGFTWDRAASAFRQACERAQRRGRP